MRRILYSICIGSLALALTAQGQQVTGDANVDVHAKARPSKVQATTSANTKAKAAASATRSRRITTGASVNERSAVTAQHHARSSPTAQQNSQSRANAGSNTMLNNRNSVRNRNTIALASRNAVNNRNVISSRNAIENRRMFNNADTVSFRNRFVVLREAHNREFFIERFGVNRVHFFNTFGFFFVFVDHCWVSVEVVGFPFSDEIICANDAAFFVP
jgi:hypothetical protein